MKKIKKTFLLLIFSLLVLSSCGREEEPLETKETLPPYTDRDLASDLGIAVSFPSLLDEDEPGDKENNQTEVTPGINQNPDEDENVFLNPDSMSASYNEYGESRMKVYREMEIYASMEDKYPQTILDDGKRIAVREIEGNSEWVEVTFDSAPFSGYAKAKSFHGVAENLELYAHLPIEYGKARTNNGDYVDAYSHLVDVRRYFKVYSDTGVLAGKTDYSKYDLVVSMKLSTWETSIGEPFYNTNLCIWNFLYSLSNL